MPVEVDSEFQYLVGYFYDVGPAEGDSELTWQGMLAWQTIKGISLDDFESTALKRMAMAYLSMRNEAKKPTMPCPRPVVDESEVSADQVARQQAGIRAQMIAWAESHNKSLKDKRKK